MEEEAPSHLNKEEEEAADVLTSSQMSMDEQRDGSKEEEEEHLMEEEERDQSKEEQAAADPPSSHPMDEEEDGDRSTDDDENDEEEDSWEAYLRSQRSYDTFAQYYRCRPMSLLGNDAAAGYDDGNRVVMPQSALERLSAVEVEYPMVFRIQNAATLQTSHVGVQEFVADEGFVHVPTHTMARLGLLPPHDGDDGELVLLTSTSLPKATSVKLQPRTSDFLGVKYPKELLEYNFRKYTCMTVGDTITVIEGERRYLLDVADEGFVHVPTHTMARLGLLPHPHGGSGEDSIDGQLVLLTSTSLPKATSVKLQPHTSDFLGVKYPKELLEYNFGKYTCMTVGETITVIEGERRYLLDVVEAKPADAVSTIETDCEVDFLPPLDYVEPTTRVSVPSTAAPVKVARNESVVIGVRMDGKPVQRPAPAKVVTGQGEGRRFAHVGVRMDGKPVEPAPMVPVTDPLAKANTYKNVLRFGAGTSMASADKAGQNADAGEKTNQAGVFTGKKYSLGD